MSHHIKAASRALCLLAALALCLMGSAGLSAARAAVFTPESTSEPFYLSGSELIYVTATGKCYHSIDDCGTTKTAFLISLAEACRLGYTPCSKCDPPAPVTAEEPTFPLNTVIVYLSVGNASYHRTPDCSGLTNAVAVPLEEALYLGKKPCNKCDPPAPP